MRSTFLFLALLCVGSWVEARDRRFEIVNRSGRTLWIGTWGYINGCSKLYQPGGGGFALPNRSGKIIKVPNDWCSGRIWARTNCKRGSNGVFHCQTGDCGDGVKCTTTGQPPATLAEFTLQEFNTTTMDTYDLSVVDGFNIGISVQTLNVALSSAPPGMNKSRYCTTSQCGTPTRPFKARACPRELRSRDGTSCLSACQAAVQGNTRYAAYVKNFDQSLVCCSCDCGPNCGCDNGKNPACKYGCSPQHPTYPPYDYPWNSVCDANSWPKSSLGVSYPQIFKRACPDAYSWQFDDATSTFNCRNSDYRVTFYPGLV